MPTSRNKISISRERTTRDIVFPDFVAPPSPCMTRTYSFLVVHTRHGATREEHRVPVSDTWFDLIWDVTAARWDHSIT